MSYIGNETSPQLLTGQDVDPSYAFGTIPSGAVMYFARQTAPTGWVACDGTAYSKTAALTAALYAAIGNTWGETSTTFNVPNLVGQFIRSYDPQGTYDKTVVTCNTTNGSATLTVNPGTQEVDFIYANPTGVGNKITVTGTGIPAGAYVTAISGTSITISANATATGTSVSLTFAGRKFGSTQNDFFESHTHSYVGGVNLAYGLEAGPHRVHPAGTTTGATGNAETRPRNVALLPCIKL